MDRYQYVEYKWENSHYAVYPIHLRNNAFYVRQAEIYTQLRFKLRKLTMSDSIKSIMLSQEEQEQLNDG